MDNLDKKIKKCVLCNKKLNQYEIAVCSSCESKCMSQELNRSGLVPDSKEKKYFYKCTNCKIKTPHIIYRVRRLKGVKLQCLRCKKFCRLWINLKRLEEVKE